MPTQTKNPLLEGKSFLERETELLKKHQEQAELEVVKELQDALDSPALLAQLKQHASCHGLRFLGYRNVSIVLSSGNRIEVKTPVFHRTMPVDRRRKHYHSNTLFHLGLEYFGFTAKCSPLLLQRILPLAALCPSFEVAAQIANCFGIQLYQRLLRDKFNHFAQEAMQMREDGLVDENYKQAGIRVVISIDGGRIRTRKARRGKKKQGAKRQGYKTDWREPYLITITLFDEQGNRLKHVQTLCDGIFDGELDDAFELLKTYLLQINLEQAQEIVFCADKGNGLWPRIDALIESLQIPQARRIIDYTHAKQNLNSIINIVKQAIKPTAKQFKKISSKFRNWLYQGDIGSIQKYINTALRYKRAKAKALKKLRDYFADPTLFQYEQYRNLGIPIGSGIVESAIRRVINLRIKAPGMFWHRDTAEKMIFMRAQILTGRWNQLCKRIFNKLALQVQNGCTTPLQIAA